ncbi:hypothetical protein P4050_30515 [Pseudomonas aeruginosa]|nr:hypothetical protein [Pseudomonas aeruginosa]
MVTLTNASRLEDVTARPAVRRGRRDSPGRCGQLRQRRGHSARGRADTVPASDPAGARVWFYDTFEAVDETVYSQGA